MSFIKHGDAQPITHIYQTSETIDEMAKESLEKLRKSVQEEKSRKTVEEDKG